MHKKERGKGKGLVGWLDICIANNTRRVLAHQSDLCYHKLTTEFHFTYSTFSPETAGNLVNVKLVNVASMLMDMQLSFVVLLIVEPSNVPQ